MRISWGMLLFSARDLSQHSHVVLMTNQIVHLTMGPTWKTFNIRALNRDEQLNSKFVYERIKKHHGREIETVAF